MVFRKDLPSVDTGHPIPLPRELDSVDYGRVLLLTEPGLIFVHLALGLQAALRSAW